MVAHGKINQFPSDHWSLFMCRGVGQNLLYHMASVHPAVMGIWWNNNWKIVNGTSFRKCTEFSPEEMIPYKIKFQYQVCKLQSLLNSRGFQTINLYIYFYIIVAYYANILLSWVSTYPLTLLHCIFGDMTGKIHGIKWSAVYIVKTQHGQACQIHGIKSRVYHYILNTILNKSVM